MTTASDPQQLADQAATEAEEIKDDIKETEAEAEQARKDGDPDRAARLEQRVKGLETKLDSVLDKLTALSERPFHPAPEAAPEAAPDDKGPAGDGAVEKDAGAEGQEKKPKGRTASRGWFGDRAGSDD